MYGIRKALGGRSNFFLLYLSLLSISFFFFRYLYLLLSLLSSSSNFHQHPKKRVAPYVTELGRRPNSPPSFSISSFSFLLSSAFSNFHRRPKNAFPFSWLDHVPGQMVHLALSLSDPDAQLRDQTFNSYLMDVRDPILNAILLRLRR